MNYISIIDKIKDVSIKHLYVELFDEGDVYAILNSGEHKYPAVILTIQSITSSNDEDFATLNGNIFYVDRLLQDSSNKLEILAMGISALELISSKVEEDLGYNGIFQTTYNVFTELFADLCAGVYQQVLIQYLKDDTCDKSIFDLNKLDIKENGVFDTSNIDQVDVNVIDKEAHERIDALEELVDALEDDIAAKDIEIIDLLELNAQKDIEIKDLNDGINAERETTINKNGEYIAEDKLGWNKVNVNLPLATFTTSAITGVHGTIHLETPEGYEGIKSATVHLITPTEERTYDITENGTTVILPREGAEGSGWKALAKATINVNVRSVEAVEISQAEYDALEEYDDYTIYLIKD